MNKNGNIQKALTFFLVTVIMAVGFFITAPFTVEAASGSVYLVADHHTHQFDAWAIKPGGIAEYQATYWLSHATDPAGIAIDESSKTLFVTSEFSGGVEMVDATTMTSLGVSSGPSNLAGIAVDDANDTVYAIHRNSNQLYVFDWDPDAKTLTVKSGLDPLDLPGCSGAFAIALDEIRGMLWVADSAAGLVRAYDVETWTEDSSLSFTPSHKPVDVGVDRIRSLVYTVSVSLGASVPGGCGSNLLSKYDLRARTETTVDLGHQGVGVAIDELTGYVYVTGDRNARKLEVWDTSATPWSQMQEIGTSGSPAGICIPQEEVVAYNPLGLSKDDGLAEGQCISPREDITYEICYDNTKNDFDVHNVIIVDKLPAQTSFLSTAGPMFVYPTGKEPNIPEDQRSYGYGGALTYYKDDNGDRYAGWLARGDKGHYVPDKYHIGQDIPAEEDDPVYAISDGEIVKVHYDPDGSHGWGQGNYGLFVKHELNTGEEFLALYGHVRPFEGESFAVEQQLTSGQPFAKIGPFSPPHLHFGIYPGQEVPGTYIDDDNPRNNIGWGRMGLNHWDDAPPANTNGFVDPINWITTQVPKSTASATYDPSTHTVIWDIGTLAAGAAQQCVQLVANVEPDASPGSTLINYATIDSDDTPSTTITESTDVCPLPDVIGLEVVVAPKRPADGEYYKVGENIEFDVTVHNPTDFDAYQVKLTAMEPPRLDIDDGWSAKPWFGKTEVDIPAGETRSTTFKTEATENGENIEVIVNAYGITDLYEAGKIRGTGHCRINIHPEEGPDWSFAVITDPHIGYYIADYNEGGWDDSAPAPNECNYEATDWLDNAVEAIIGERDYYNIEFVIVLGDITDTAEKSEFFKARWILNKLNDPDGDPSTDDGIPYIPVIGNHDQWPYTQVGGDDFDKDPASKADHAVGDEWFNDIFWGDGIGTETNKNLIKNVFKVSDVDKKDPVQIEEVTHQVYLQNRSFSYWEEGKEDEKLNFICLDYNKRADEPGRFLWGFFAGVHPETTEYLENHLENGKTTVILSHHPLSNGIDFMTSGFINSFEPNRIAKIVYENDCGGKTYNFAGHTHLSNEDSVNHKEWDWWEGIIEHKAYKVISTEAVNERTSPHNPLSWPLPGQRDYAPLRIVQINGGELDYETLLKPTKEVAIEWPNPIIDYIFGGHSYPEPNEEITFTAHFTSDYGFSTQFDWDFGDGSTASSLWPSVTHNYSEEGDYDVTLTVITRNLVTGEETTQSTTRTVCVRNKHVISSLPPGLNATSLITEEDLTQIPKNTYQPVLIAKAASEETTIALLQVHFEEANGDIDLSTLVADVDPEEAKSVLYMPSWPPEIEEYKNLCIPSTGAGAVYICLDAASLGEVSPENADFVVNAGETKNRITVTTTYYDGCEYYLVCGVTGTGGGEIRQAANEPPVADAGPDQTVCATATAMTAMAMLDGSGSYDPDGDPLTYNWTWDGNTASSVSPTVELPPGTTTITLVVNDGKVDSEPDTVDITVQIPATIDFVPDVLNREAKGKYVTAYIELPPGYDVSQIDISSIRLNNAVPALTKPTEVDDYDSDGVADLMVKFDRAAVQDELTISEALELIITGEVAGIDFEGSDTINRVITPSPPGLTQWTRVSTPITEGWVLAPDSVIVHYAVADDGEVAYTIVYSYGDSEFHLLKSADYAATWEDIMETLEEEADGDINWLVAVATDAEDADFVAVTLEMTDLSVHVFVSDDGGVTFEDAGEVQDGGIYFPDGYCVSDLEVSPEVDGERDVAIGGRDSYGDAALFRCKVNGDSATVWEDATGYDGWDDDSDFTSILTTDMIFSPSWDEDRTILVNTVTETGMDIYTVHLQCGSWGMSEGWNEDSTLGIEAVPIIEDVGIPMWLADFDARRIAGMTLPEDYNSKSTDTRKLWVWVNYYWDYGIDEEPTSTIFRVKNDNASPVGPLGQVEDGELWLTNVSYKGTITEGEAIAGVLGTGGYVSSPDELLTECCEGVQIYRNDNIVNMDICCVPWEEACKPPTGTFAMAVSYVGEDKAYAVSLWGFFSPYDEDAWSVSFDDGDNWNQLSLVDTYIDYFSDVAISPDCNKTILVSVNEESGCGCDSVWLHAENLPEAEEYSGKWLRTWCNELENNYGLLRLTPEETNGDTVYLVDRESDTVYWNEMETLDCWDCGAVTVDHIVDLAIKSRETIYALDYYGDVAMSDDYALGWHAPVDSKVEYGWTIAVRGDDILVGGMDGDVSYSDDGGETFTLLEETPTINGYVTVAFDSYFDQNGKIYNASYNDDHTGGIYRWIIGESDEWENLGAEDYAYTSLVLNIPSDGKPETSPETGGILYASYVGYEDALLVGGVARCPTLAQDVYRRRTKWDYLTRGLTSELFKMTPQALKICGCLTAYTNVRLFAIDSSEYYDMVEGLTGTIWSFED